MKIAYANGTDKDFVFLTHMLDDEYYERFGEIALSYRKHNTLESIIFVVVIYEDDKPIACGGYKKYDESIVEMKRIFVTKPYRGRGISKLIMRELEQHAFDAGYKYAVLQTGVGLKRALALYKSIGYEVIPNFDEFEGDDICVCFKKCLEEKA